MKISKQELIDMMACEDGLSRFTSQTNNTDEPVEVISLIGGKNTYKDLLWLASKKLEKKKIERFACDVALINIELIKPYTSDYDLIVDFLRGDISKRAAAGAAGAGAAAAAYAAADAAYAAYAYAAYAAANAAAAVIATNADAVAYTAYVYAAYAAANAAAARECEEEINKLLVELFEGES